MKIFYSKSSGLSPDLRFPLLKTIRVSIVVLLILLSPDLWAYSDTQNFKLTINFKNATIKETIKNISASSKIEFLYSDSQISDVSKRVTASFVNAPLEDILNEVLTGTNLTYKLNDNSIVIVPWKQQQPANQAVKKTIVISGKITDKENGQPISGVAVIVPGTNKGIVSDINGAYSFSVAGETKMIRFTFVGYRTHELKLNGNDQKFNLVMVSSETDIDDVIVTGIFRKSAESFTGSIVSVTAKELEQFGNRNILTSLRNIDPSFNIIESNTWGSNPNKLPEIQIRGNSSIPNVDELKDNTRVGMNTPLVIIDGFEQTLQRLMDMNNNEVQNITLLKDASATAIYGSRGANGVIVIVTKSPTMGKLRVSYRGDLNVEIPDINSYSLLGAREKLDLEYRVGKFDDGRAERDVVLKQYYNFLLNDVNSGVNTDWLSKPLRVGIGQRHNVKIEGGDKTFRYSASGQYNDVQGVMKGSSRGNFNGNITLSYYHKNIKFSNNFIIGLNNSNESPYGSFDQYVKMNPYFRTHDANGNVLSILGYDEENGGYGYRQRYYYDKEPTYNPLYNATLNMINKNQSTTLTNNFSIDWNLSEDLTIKGRVGVGKTLGESDLFYPAEHTMFDAEEFRTDEGFMRKGRYNKGNNKMFNYDASLNLSYSKLFAEKHLLYTAIDLNVRENTSMSHGFVVEGFPNSNLNYVSMALQYQKNGTCSGGESLERGVGVVGTANYTYDNRYYADLSYRIDGSSKFGSEKRFAPFWSAGIGWNLHREKFLADFTKINKLKLRASVGTTGTQNFNPYQSLSMYMYYTGDRYYQWIGNYMMGLGNENLKWQQEKNYNIGTDIALFNDRIQVTADVYRSVTEDLVSSVNIPATNGFTSYKENIGRMKNEGIELKVTGVIIKNDEWYWSITGAAMSNKNKVVEISQALKDAQKSIETEKSANPNLIYREGYSINTIWVVPSLGIDPSTGKELYLNRFGDITYTWDARDLRDCGDSEPKWTGNLNSILRYKNLTLTMSFGYRFGGKLYNSTLINKVENTNYEYNVDSRVYNDRWKKPGQTTFFNGIYVTTYTNKTSRFVQKEKTFNCQNVNLMYDFRSKMLKDKVGIEHLSISANFADLFYISSVKRERGISYPFSRQASMTVSATF